MSAWHYHIGTSWECLPSFVHQCMFVLQKRWHCTSRAHRHLKWEVVLMLFYKTSSKVTARTRQITVMYQFGCCMAKWMLCSILNRFRTAWQDSRCCSVWSRSIVLQNSLNSTYLLLEVMGIAGCIWIGESWDSNVYGFKWVTKSLRYLQVAPLEQSSFQEIQAKELFLQKMCLQYVASVMVHSSMEVKAGNTTLSKEEHIAGLEGVCLLRREAALRSRYVWNAITTNVAVCTEICLMLPTHQRTELPVRRTSLHAYCMHEALIACHYMSPVTCHSIGISIQ